ncbi:SRPBCC family protein [Actinotalea sp. K2]|uniref:SRPBCC family protein n=1 Tax=Actinotalea sp. K2 TaxID=2939438 RepID=UPI00201770C1|nr:SRPBCC family protein [Actinotalea sp. K2]MCL3861815.1 SRPBCC family protein [Actinotalea sp. K2]
MRPTGSIESPLLRGTPWLLGGAALVVAARVGRQWMATWGSTAAESTQVLPGDDLVRDPLRCVTRAVDICAPADAVWPWIAQIGSSDLGRAGWYSYDRFDNGGVPSADRLLPEVPAPEVGQPLVSDPDFAWTVRAVEPGRALVLDIRPPGRLAVHATFALVVEPVDADRCRLVERSWWDMRPRWAGVPASLAFETVDFVMMRKHLVTVRALAESAHRVGRS